MTPDQELKLWRRLAMRCLGASADELEHATIVENRDRLLVVHAPREAFGQMINSHPPARVLMHDRQVVLVSDEKSGAEFARVRRARQ